MNLRKRTYFLAAIGWFFFITAASLFPISGTSNVKTSIPDKVIHIAFYTGFTVLWYLYLYKKPIKHLLLKIFLASFFYGIIIELLQAIMPYGRHFEIKDIIANTIGSLIGIIGPKIYTFRLKTTLKRKK